MLAGVALFAAVQHYPHNQILQRYGPGFVAEAGGIVVTLVLVNWIVRRQRKRAIEPTRHVAIGKLLGAFADLVHELSFMVKASSRAPVEHPTTVSALVDHWVRAVPRLNFLASAGRLPGHPDEADVNWGVFLNEGFKKLDGNFASLLDLYAGALGSELIVAIESLRASYVFRALRDGISAQEGQKPHPDREPFLALAAPESGNALAAFGNRVDQLGTALEHAIGYAAGLHIDSMIWRHDVGPGWGTAYYTGPMDTRLTRTVILDGGRLPAAGPEYAGQIRLS